MLNILYTTSYPSFYPFKILDSINQHDDVFSQKVEKV